MQAANLVRSVMYLFDCYCDDFHDETYVKSVTDLEMRAQIEVRIRFYKLSFVRNVPFMKIT